MYRGPVVRSDTRCQETVFPANCAWQLKGDQTKNWRATSQEPQAAVPFLTWTSTVTCPSYAGAAVPSMLLEVASPFSACWSSWLPSTSALTTCSPSCSCGLCSAFVSSSFPRSRPRCYTARSVLALPTGSWPWAIHDSGYHGSRITTPSGGKSQFCVQVFISPCREFAFQYTMFGGDGPNLSHFSSHSKSEL